MYPVVMSTTSFTPEIRAKILSAIKDEGLSIVDAAKTYGLHEATIRKWLRGTMENSASSSSELQRLRKENQSLKEIIGCSSGDKRSGVCLRVFRVRSDRVFIDKARNC